MNGDIREMRRFIDQRTLDCSAYLVLTNALLGIHPLVANECECVIAEMLHAIRADVALSYEQSVEVVKDLTLANLQAIEEQLTMIALMPPGIAGPLRALLRDEENDNRIYPAVQMIVARFVALHLHEVGQIAKASCS